MPEISSNIGGLSSVILQAEERTKPTLAVILCHGYGASGQDLVPIGRELISRQEFRSFRFVFPAAPISLGNFGFGDSRAWWELDVQRYSSLDLRDMSAIQNLQREIPSGLPRARRMLMAAVQETSRQSGLSISNILLGGFSQGAMLATDVALKLDEAPAGLAILSGALICADDWAKRAATRSNLPVFQSHGRQDVVLPYFGGENLRTLLSGAGLNVDFHPFEGGHGIPGPVLQGFARFLTEQAKR